MKQSEIRDCCGRARASVFKNEPRSAAINQEKIAQGRIARNAVKKFKAGAFQPSRKSDNWCGSGIRSSRSPDERSEIRG
jgi:hypothetical protein